MNMHNVQSIRVSSKRDIKRSNFRLKNILSFMVIGPGKQDYGIHKL